MYNVYLPNMEMRYSRVVIASLYLPLVLVLPFVNSELTFCDTTRECDVAVQFCDTSTRSCMFCRSLPCSKPTIDEQGDGWCRKICPDFWQNHLHTTTTTTTEKSLTYTGARTQDTGEAQKLEQRSGEQKTEGNGSAGGNVAYIIVGVLLGLAALIGGSFVVFIIYRRRLQGHRPEEEADLDPDRDLMLAPRQDTHGPIRQDQGGA